MSIQRYPFQYFTLSLIPQNVISVLKTNSPNLTVNASKEKTAQRQLGNSFVVVVVVSNG